MSIIYVLYDSIWQQLKLWGLVTTNMLDCFQYLSYFIDKSQNNVDNKFLRY